ncbi:MAG TPA: response regulator [Steroidobacteraceae bacterium]
MATESLSAPAQMSRSVASVTPLVFIVDDDVSVRESIEFMVEHAGWRAEGFASAREFLDRPRTACACCLVLDLSLPDLNGLEVQKRIVEERSEMPIIFITGRGDVPTSVQAMKAGAVEFLTKPFEPDTLLNAIESALNRSRALLQELTSLQALRDRHGALSRREREVMALVVRGQLNKQVAGALGISEITVKAHRGRVMRKMRVRSLPELVNIAARLGLFPPDES